MVQVYFVFIDLPKVRALPDVSTKAVIPGMGGCSGIFVGSLLLQIFSSILAAINKNGLNKNKYVYHRLLFLASVAREGPAVPCKSAASVLVWKSPSQERNTHGDPLYFLMRLQEGSADGKTSSEAIPTGCILAGVLALVLYGSFHKFGGPHRLSGAQ